MEHRAKAEISTELLEKVQRYLTEEPETREDALDEDDPIIVTAVFDDEFEMDIKCCGVQWLFAVVQFPYTF